MRKILWLLPLLAGCGSQTIPSNTTMGASSKYTIQLTWQEPSGSDPAVSYNIYRETTADAGGFSQVNTFPVVAVTYTDSNVRLGTSYMYVVRAMDAEGQESAPSNTATVKVPAN